MNPPDTFSTAQQRLHQQAIQDTGYSDFGDEGYREGLQILLDAYDNEAQFSEIGRYSAWAMLLNSLRGRLYAQAGITQHPQCLSNTIEKPLFIIGLPRTGTTILHRLLAQDPGNQGLEYWLGSYPLPRPPQEQWGQHPRHQEVASSLDMLLTLSPDMKSIHEMTVDGADECRLLLMQSFANVTFQANATVPSYEQWLYQANMQKVYQQYANTLKLIGSNEPQKRWVLKDPSHLWAMDTLLETFPDACIVQTHRDPTQLIPSVSSLVLTARHMAEPGITPAQIGREQLEQWRIVLEKGLAVREQYPDNFHDVYFTDFINDPVAEIRKIYQRFDNELSDATAKQLQQWMHNNPQGKHGSHHYSPEDFGLSEKQIRDTFSHYQHYFNL